MNTTTDSIVVGTRVSLAVRKRLRILAANQDTNVGELLRKEIERLVEAPQLTKPKAR